MTKTTPSLPQALTDAVIDASERVPVGRLLRRVTVDCGSTLRQARAALGELVAAGELIYTYELGSTFVVPSFDRPVRISRRLVLRPANRTYLPAAGEKVVSLAAGAAFGTGAHATTRLALEGIDLAMESRCRAADGQFRALDLGTGSGVLVMAAVLLGADSGLGTDIDPCALSEARANVAANGLGRRIAIEDRAPEEIAGRFCLITANLRLPTLMRLCPDFVRLVEKRGGLVVSGLREAEAPGVIGRFAGAGFECRWQAARAGWAGMWFRLAS